MSLSPVIRVNEPTTCSHLLSSTAYLALCLLALSRSAQGYIGGRRLQATHSSRKRRIGERAELGSTRILWPNHARNVSANPSRISAADYLKRTVSPSCEQHSSDFLIPPYFVRTAKVASSSAFLSIFDQIYGSLTTTRAILHSSIIDPLDQLSKTFHAASLSLFSPSIREQLSKSIVSIDSGSSHALSAAAVTVLTIVIFTMAGWGRNFFGAGGRFSPFGASPYPPQVTDEDYSYITADELAEPHHHTQAPVHESSRAPRGHVRPSDDDDTINFRIQGVTYPAYFKKYSIDDGDLAVTHLKMKAAELTGVGDTRKIKLLYKGKVLKDDSRSCREEGLKMDSEVLCMVSDDHESSDRVEDDASGSDGDTTSTGEAASTRKRTRNRKKKSSKKSGSGQAGTASPYLAPPDVHLGGSSRPSSPASSSGPKTALEKLDELSSLFQTKFLPESMKFTKSPPSDTAKREFEHKKLTETILSQILLKYDAVETEGDPEARQRRKDLVKETQSVLNSLDAVLKNYKP